MIGELKEHRFHQRNGETSVEITVEIPERHLTGEKVNNDSIYSFMRKRNGREVGFDLSPPQQEEQRRLDQIDE